jgi:hypothetical protein
MPVSDVFTLKNSSLNTFLFARVGVEPTGLPLTMLSVLARLGNDPWAKAAEWSKLPRAAIIDRLVESIGRMPPDACDPADVRGTATRLARLLPDRLDAPEPSGEPASVKRTMPKWLPIALLAAGAMMALGLQLAPSKPTSAVAPAALVQPANPPH